jgi:acetyltransferase
MRALMQAAREHGLQALVGEVLADNAPMLKLVRELGFSTRRSAEDAGVYTVERWL